MTTHTQLVLFDIGNVILRATHAITYAILAELGVRPDQCALFFHGKHYGDFARGKITGHDFARDVCRVLEVPESADALIRTAHDAHIYAVDEAVLDVLHALHGRNVPLAFVTTTNAWQTERERALIDLAGQFGPVVRSHEIGMTKTDRDAWPMILKELGWQDRDPSSILLVDDSKSNCRAAMGSVGLDYHQYDPTLVKGISALGHALVERGLLPNELP
ncbi:hypothetical protein HY480_04020 [Candidatus Uhrbacteria bacterium]|nr:hypothetical protein [Candidatus Uhrbacteria bacterium]